MPEQFSRQRERERVSEAGTEQISAARNSPICKFPSWNEEDGASFVLPNWTGGEERAKMLISLSLSYTYVLQSVKEVDLTLRRISMSFFFSGGNPTNFL